MGKNRVSTIGDESAEAQEKQKKALKKAEKKAREQAETKAQGEEVEEKNEQPQTQDEQTQTGQEQTPTEEVTTEAAPKKAKKEKFKKAKQRSTAYGENIVMVEKNRAYSLSEALDLLKKFKKAKFDETVELHINTTTPGVSGSLKLPHGNGKEVKVAVATDELIAQVEKGKIDFDILVANPDMMPKLAKVARVLGPKGLMPNPKNGTISENPQEAAKKFQGGQMNFKTESNLPLIHLSVGKVSFENDQLEANIKTVITSIKKDRIRNVTLKSTMSPGIRLSI